MAVMALNMSTRQTAKEKGGGSRKNRRPIIPPSPRLPRAGNLQSVDRQSPINIRRPAIGIRQSALLDFVPRLGAPSEVIRQSDCRESIVGHHSRKKWTMKTAITKPMVTRASSATTHPAFLMLLDSRLRHGPKNRSSPSGPTGIPSFARSLRAAVGNWDHLQRRTLRGKVENDRSQRPREYRRRNSAIASAYSGLRAPDKSQNFPASRSSPVRRRTCPYCSKRYGSNGMVRIRPRRISFARHSSALSSARWTLSGF